MLIFSDVASTQAQLQAWRKAGDTIGFVATMGALHEGHLALIQRSKAENTRTVCSIYVNPTQFNNLQDLEKYPRHLEKDATLLAQAECDLLFAPADSEMYHKPPLMRLHFGALEEVMEGRFRPGHFNGVALVVSKLLHIIAPQRAYFGQKDLQQFAIIKQLVEDLSFPVALVCHEIVREADGLAMSSRNQRLSSSERQEAAQIYQALELGAATFRTKGPQAAKEAVHAFFEEKAHFRLEYFEIAAPDSLQSLAELRFPAALCIAAFLGDVRLIDNLIITS
jgi:pantoate--beta-alanine ligase